MANKFYNFDKFISEKDREQVTVQILGKSYSFNRQIPAILPVLMARQEGIINRAEQTKLLMKAADVLFGSKAVDQMCADGLATDDFVVIIQKAFELVGSNEEDDSDAEELDDESGKKVVGGNPAKK